MTTWSGGCACGAVRYVARGQPLRMLKCYCQHCRQASGSAFAAVLTMPRDGVEMQGELRWYARTGGSGQAVQRGFCASCGSPIAVAPTRLPKVLGLQAESLDDPAAFRAELELYTDAAPDWGEGSQKFGGAYRRD